MMNFSYWQSQDVSHSCGNIQVQSAKGHLTVRHQNHKLWNGPNLYGTSHCWHFPHSSSSKKQQQQCKKASAVQTKN